MILTSCAHRSAFGAPWFIQYLFTAFKTGKWRKFHEHSDPRTVVKQVASTEFRNKGINTWSGVNGDCGAVG